MKKETSRLELETMPYDKKFDTGNGEELCHATGFEVQFDNETTPLGDPCYWNEYMDSEGDLHYGR